MYTYYGFIKYSFVLTYSPQVKQGNSKDSSGDSRGKPPSYSRVPLGRVRAKMPLRNTKFAIWYVSNFTRWTTQRNQIFEVVKERFAVEDFGYPLGASHCLHRCTVPQNMGECCYNFVTINRLGAISQRVHWLSYIPMDKSRGFTKGFK